MGHPISIVIPDDMREKIEAILVPGESLTALIRQLLREALEAREQKAG